MGLGKWKLVGLILGVWLALPLRVWADDKAPPAPTAPTTGPTTTPAGPTTGPAHNGADNPNRVLPPNADAQADAGKIIAEVYKDDINRLRSVEDRTALARKWLETGLQTANDSAGRYVMLNRSVEMAADAGDIATTIKALDAISQSYWIDDVGMYADAVIKAARKCKTPGQQRELIAYLWPIIDRAVAADRYEAADRICALTETTAQRTSDAALVRQAQGRWRDVREIQAADAQLTEVRSALRKDPDQPEANQKLGRFYCLVKGQWNVGLALLAKGSPSPEHAIALRELAAADEADAQVAIGDAWWELAQKEKGLSQRNLELHAAQWYREAAAAMTGLAKTKIQKRLADLAATGEPDRWTDILAFSGAPRAKLKGAAVANADNVVLGPDDASITSLADVVVPFEAQIIAKTDSTNIRINFAKGGVILNWEARIDELHCAAFASGKDASVKGKGKIVPNQWQTIILSVADDHADIFVNGELRGQIKENFKGLKGPLAVTNAAGSTVTLEFLRVARAE